MLIRLLRTHLRPYRTSLTIIVAAPVLGTVAALYLPSLNADIIDYGVPAATRATSCAPAA